MRPENFLVVLLRTCGQPAAALTHRLNGLMRAVQLGRGSTGLISGVNSEISTTVRKQMGAITEFSPSSSVCSVLVNTCVAGGSGDGVGTKTYI